MELTTPMDQRKKPDKIKVSKDEEYRSGFRIDLIKNDEILEKYDLSVLYYIDGNFNLKTNKKEYQNLVGYEAGYDEEGNV